jgi:threonine synthase
MLGFQAAGASPIVKGHPVDDPRTIATAIRIGNPASWDGATGAAADSGGAIAAVRDKDILDAYRLIAREEGLFCELASAASVAGLLQLHAAGDLPRSGVAVCILTGNGLKDPDWAIAGAPPPRQVGPHVDEVAEAIGF